MDAGVLTLALPEGLSNSLQPTKWHNAPRTSTCWPTSQASQVQTASHTPLTVAFESRYRVSKAGITIREQKFQS
jgi:hypothetical protein